MLDYLESNTQQPVGDAGKAGWKLAGDIGATIGSNATAYGLFLINSSSAGLGSTTFSSGDASAGGADGSVQTEGQREDANYGNQGRLAAVFYADEGSLALSGNMIEANHAEVGSSGGGLSNGQGSIFWLNHQVVTLSLNSSLKIVLMQMYLMEV